jgi:hypothetical protein
VAAVGYNFELTPKRTQLDSGTRKMAEAAEREERRGRYLKTEKRKEGKRKKEVNKYQT